jgi:hypothetical protein
VMPPLKTGHTNAMLGAPVDWDPAVHGECIGLPVHRDQQQGVWLSWYQPTEQDIANILAGVPIRLSVFGNGHPPVAISVTAGTEPL